MTLETYINKKMEKGPYIRTVLFSKIEVCNYCQHCDAAKVYASKSVKVIYAKCKHPNVIDFAPAYGRHFYDYLDHDDTDIHTPDWCPVKKLDKVNSPNVTQQP